MVDLAEDARPEQEATKKKGKSKKKLFVALLAIVVLTAAGAGGGLWYMRKSSKAHPGLAKAKHAAPKKALYLSLDPPLVVNFQGGRRINYLQVGVDVMSYDQHVLDDVKANMPMLRNDLIMLFTNQDFHTLSTRDGRQKLRKQVLKTVRNVLAKTGLQDAAKVQAVYFTKFVMQ